MEQKCIQCGKIVPGDLDPPICSDCLSDETIAHQGAVPVPFDPVPTPRPHQPGEEKEDTPETRMGGPGDWIGNYQLIEVLGEGGFGIVYKAKQERPVKREVALKVIKPGMDSEEIIERFEAEKQALALMDHPHIAQVFDGGTTENGRPYFVMELVEGLPISLWCSQHQLSIRDRLDLFAKVCQGIQHAHQKAVIHRDLKPNNILVELQDGEPVPKIIDFGVAKALGQQLTENTLHTALGAVIGTPQYMSPEQTRMALLEDIDTRSDIYSLGAVLYELLTGGPPIEKEKIRRLALDELLKAIREEEPVVPSKKVHDSSRPKDPDTTFYSTISRRLDRTSRGELDWIVMKALEKDRNRRYESASAFADDIVKHLSGDPVSAGPPSVSYRFRKFARKHRLAMITTSLVLVALLGAVAVSSWMAVLASRANRESQHSLGLVWLSRSEKSAEERDYLTALFYAGRSLGFKKGTGQQPVWEKWLSPEPEPFPRLLKSESDAYKRAHSFIESQPKYLPIWNVRVPESEVVGVSMSPDGRYVIANLREGSARLWDFKEQSASVFEPKSEGDDDADPFSAAKSAPQPSGNYRFSRDGLFLIAIDSEGGVQLRQPNSPFERIAILAEAAESSPEESSESATIFGAASEIKMASGGDPETVDSVYLAAFNPRGDRLVVTSRKESQSVLDIWDIADTTAIKRLEFRQLTDNSKITAIAISSAGSVFAGTREGRIHYSTKEYGYEELPQSDSTITSLATNPDGDLLLCGTANHEVLLFDMSGAMSHRESPGEPYRTTNRLIYKRELFKGPVIDLEFSPDGGRFLAASRDGTIEIWKVESFPDPEGKAEARLNDFSPAVTSAEFSSCGSTLLASYANGKVTMWNVSGHENVSAELFTYLDHGWFQINPESRELEAGSPGTEQSDTVINAPENSLVALWNQGNPISDKALTEAYAIGKNWAGAERIVSRSESKDELIEIVKRELDGVERGGNSWARHSIEKLVRTGEIPSPEQPDHFTNGAGIAMVWCPPTGENGFLMGGGNGYKSSPRHRVILSDGFWIGKHEVTQGQWKLLVGENPSFFIESGAYAPVENFDWEDLEVFLRELNRTAKEQGGLPGGWEYQLPTEAQWEYAARAGKPTDWTDLGSPFGFGKVLNGFQANCNGSERPIGTSSLGPNRERTLPVGSFPDHANDWGIFDMHGNVSEWCSDGLSNYPKFKVMDPRFFPNEEKRGNQIHRGGSWQSRPEKCRTVNRAVHPRYKHFAIGFRVVLARKFVPLKPGDSQSEHQLPIQMQSLFFDKVNGRKLTLPFRLEEGFTSIEINIGRGWDESGDQRMTWKLTDRVGGKVVQSGFSDKQEVLSWRIDNLDGKQFVLTLEDSDTLFEGKLPGNAFDVGIRGVK